MKNWMWLVLGGGTAVAAYFLLRKSDHSLTNSLSPKTANYPGNGGFLVSDVNAIAQGLKTTVGTFSKFGDLFGNSPSSNSAGNNPISGSETFRSDFKLTDQLGYGILETNPDITVGSNNSQQSSGDAAWSGGDWGLPNNGQLVY